MPTYLQFLVRATTLTQAGDTPDFAHLYVLLHTSLNSAMNSEKARLAGANAVLTKFSSPELTQCLILAARTVAEQGF